MTDIEILDHITHITDEWEGIDSPLPAFQTFDSLRIPTEQIAELLVLLQEHTGPFPVTYYPDCIMDIVDMALQRPRTLDRLRSQSVNHPTLHPYIPYKTWWQRVKEMLKF